MAPAGEFTKALWSGKLELLIANFKLKDVSTYHPAAVCAINFSLAIFLNIYFCICFKPPQLPKA